MAFNLYHILALTILICLAFVLRTQAQDKLVTDICMGCLCEAASGCNQTNFCSSSVCGPFRITQPYWKDGGALTVGNDAPGTEQAFANCVNDVYCAANTVQNYMTKFKQDCNGDGVVDCYDYASIHKLGGFGCQGDLNFEYFTALEQCLSTYSNIDVRIN